MKPYDPDFVACGEGKAADYPYIYFSDPLSAKKLTTTVCVKTCPKDDKDLNIKCLKNSVVKGCNGKKYSAFMEEEFNFEEKKDDQKKDDKKKDDKKDENKKDENKKD